MKPTFKSLVLLMVGLAIGYAVGVLTHPGEQLHCYSVDSKTIECAPEQYY